MEQNEEKKRNYSQELVFKYLIESIQKQQQNQSSSQIDQHFLNDYSRLRKQTEKYKSSLDVNRDYAYLERRRKNNEAAKRSRDARRAKEDEIALRAALLEQENIKLRLDNVNLKQENIQLRCQIYSSTNS